MSWEKGKHLVMHVDSNIVPERPFLRDLPLPEATETWQPVSHLDFDNLVQRAIEDAGIKIKSSEYGMSRPDEYGFRHKFFVAHDTVDEVTDGVGMIIGARNSTDKSFAAGLVFGSRVFICDNTAFSGEYVLRRKHTAHILRDLPKMIAAGMGTYFNEVEAQGKLIDRMKNYRLSPHGLETHDLLVRSAERRIIPWADIPKVKKEFIEPTKNVAEPTMWGLHNAFTYTLQKYVEGTRVDRTLRLSGVFRSEFADLQREYREGVAVREELARANER